MKSKIHITLVIAMIFFISKKGSAQQSYDITKIIPPSPTAASLGVYGDVNVGLYTGTPQIDVPIYTITSGDIAITMKLDYLASGVKVGQDASWVGLNWSLQAGGLITKTTRGLDDFILPGGFYNDTNLPPSNANNNLAFSGIADPSIPLNWQEFRKINQGIRDSEPDIFFYNFNNTSGRFVMDKSTNGGGKYVASINNLTIEFIPATSNTWIVTGSWKITTAEGYQYYFKTEEKVRNYYYSGSLATEKPGINGVTEFTGDTFPSTASWYLSSVVSPTNQDTVTFEYSQISNSLSLTNKSYEAYTTIDISDPNPPSGDPLGEWHIPDGPVNYKGCSASRQQIGDVYLKKINFKNGSVVFNTSAREDIEQYIGTVALNLR